MYFLQFLIIYFLFPFFNFYNFRFDFNFVLKKKQLFYHTLKIIYISFDINFVYFLDGGGVGSVGVSGELKFRCSICWKGFKHPNSLTLHKDLHSGKTKCPVCSRSFSRSYDMRTHMSKIHKITLSLETKVNFRKF